MRDIKFRLWNRELKKIFYLKGFVIDKGKIGYYIIPNGTGTCSIDDADMMLYTGIKDRTGREIYEGDIIRLELSNETKNCIVTWKERQAAFGFEYFIVDSWALSWDEETIPKQSEWAVIGNIYEDPHLAGK
jgi:uncharacterized phage protein (TIGR01671 family)